MSKRNPSGYWNKKRCHEEALKHQIRVEFQKGNGSAYKSAQKNGWLDEVCSHMKSRFIWTKEHCHKEALKYKIRIDLKKGSSGAYHSALRNGWLDEVCSHMKRLYKPKGYWNKKMCHKEALRYKIRIDLKKGSSGAYNSAQINGWLDEICSHMIEIKKPLRYWNKERCHKGALTYETRMDFQKGNVSAYNAAQKNGWLDEVCSHMKVLGHKGMRYIYVFEFEDRFAYVGLSYNPNKRELEHLEEENSAVYIHIRKTNSNYNLNIITEEPIETKEACKLEKDTVKKYLRNGWTILNRTTAGSIGATKLHWNKERCQEESLKHGTKREFKEKSGGAYSSAKRNGWMDEVCSHMKRNISWTKEKCQEIAWRHQTRICFSKLDASAYNTARRYGWLDEVCSHMKRLCKPKGYWNKKRCHEEALKYQTRTEFQKGSVSAYGAAHINGWMDEVCSHIK